MVIHPDQQEAECNSSKRVEPDPSTSQPGGGVFEIHVKGHLNSKWSDWLEGMEVRLLENGEMLLTGTIVDQAALLGALNKLNRLNLTILSVNELHSKDSSLQGKRIDLNDLAEER